MRSHPSIIAGICLAFILAVGLPWLCADASGFSDASAMAGDCDGCDRDGALVHCDALGCGVAALAAPVAPGVRAAPILADDGREPVRPVQDRSAGPEPFPPRITATA